MRAAAEYFADSSTITGQGAFDNCETAPTDIAVLQPDIVLMDIDMPGLTGIEGVRNIRVKNQDVKILMLTVFDDNKNVFEAIKAGANGYVLKKNQPRAADKLPARCI